MHMCACVCVCCVCMCMCVCACLCACREDDNEWPDPSRVGRQELEIVCGNRHISFVVCIGCVHYVPIIVC